jgi:hypothetical protein
MAAMAVTSSSAGRTTSTVLSLSKRTWRLGILLSRIDQHTETPDTTAAMLTEEVKTLGLECDLVYSELETVAKTERILFDIDSRLWLSIEMLVQETNLTMGELERFIERNRYAQSNNSAQSQQQREAEKNKEQIVTLRTEVCRHTDSLHAVSLLINT